MNQTKHLYLFFFLFFSLCTISAQQGVIVTAQQADQSLEKAWEEMGNNNELAQENAAIVLNWAQARQDQERAAEAHLILGRIGWLIREFADGEKHLGQALRLFRERGDSTGVVSSLIELGTHMRVQQRFDVAFTHYAQALKITQDHLPDNFEKLGHANMVMGNVYNNLENYDQAIDHFQIAHEAFLQTGDSTRALAPLGNMTYSLRKIGRSDEAVKILLKIEGIRENAFDKSIAWLQLAEVYHEVAAYEKSFFYAQKLFSYDSTERNAYGRLPYAHTLRVAWP